MTTAPKQKWREVAISLIDVPKEYVRKQPNEDADKSLSASVKLSGIIQPLAVVPNGKGGFDLVDGTRRMVAAEENGLGTVPIIVNHPPKGTTGKALKAYRDRLRQFLNTKRQDLTPSQWVEVVAEAQRMFKLNNKEMAALLQVDPATITNRNRIKNYAAPIVAAIDRGDITLHHAQALDGLKPGAQVKVFEKMRNDFVRVSGRVLKGLVREQFNPKYYPRMWADPEKSTKRIRGSKAKRERLIEARAPSLKTRAELDRLLNDVEMWQTEFEENRKEIERANLLIRLVGPIHRAVSNDETLLDYVAKKWPMHLPALERFSELV